MLPWPVPTRARSGLLAALAVAAAVIALRPTLISLHELWVGIFDYSHGYLIAGVSIAWLALVLRKHWADPARPSLLGGVLLALGLCAWLVAYNANSLILHQLLAPVIMCCAVFATTGWSVARSTIPPLAFVWFAMPVWEYLLPVLQRLSVFATENTLALLGVPVDVQEYTVTIPEGTFQIIEGCSGKRFFMVALALGTLAGTVSGLRHRRLVAFVALSGALALVANWIRIAIVIYVGHATNMQHYIVAVEHRTLGHVVFGVLMVVIALLARWWAPAAAGRSENAHVVGATASPATPSAFWPAAVPLGLLLATIALTEARASTGIRTAELGTLPVAVGTWQGPLPAQPDWAPTFQGPDAERRAAYRSADGTVEVYVAAYAEQRQGRELVHHRNTLLAPGAWHRAWPATTTRIAGRAAAPLAAFEARSADGGLWLLAYTFSVGGWRTTSEPLAQLAYGVRSLVKPVPAGVLALATRCHSNCERARALVTSFWDDMSLPILDVVPDTVRNP